MSHRSPRAEAMFPVVRSRDFPLQRAIAKKPEIFIFDDSFSALDFKTDSTLRKALKEHTKDTTTIIVAQRTVPFSMQNKTLYWMMAVWQESEHLKSL